MKDLEKLLRNLPPREMDFSIDVKGDISGIRYTGDFECSMPDLEIQSEVDKHRAYLDGVYSAALTVLTRRLHYQVAYLKQVITSAPNWWVDSHSGHKLLDRNVIEEVYSNVLDCERKWLIKIHGEDTVQSMENEAQKDLKEDEEEKEESSEEAKASE